MNRKHLEEFFPWRLLNSYVFSNPERTKVQSFDGTLRMHYAASGSQVACV